MWWCPHVCFPGEYIGTSWSSGLTAYWSRWWSSRSSPSLRNRSVLFPGKIINCGLSVWHRSKKKKSLVSAALLHRGKCRWLMCARHTGGACYDAISGIRLVFLSRGSGERLKYISDLHTGIEALGSNTELRMMDYHKGVPCSWRYTVAASVTAHNPASGSDLCIRAVWEGEKSLGFYRGKTFKSEKCFRLGGSPALTNYASANLEAEKWFRNGVYFRNYFYGKIPNLSVRS